MSVSERNHDREQLRQLLKHACDKLASIRLLPNYMQESSDAIDEVIELLQIAHTNTPAAFNVDPEDAVLSLIKAMGEPNPTRPGLLETPARVVKFFKERGSGYGADPATIIKTFEDGAEGYDQMIVQRKIPFWSTCEHHAAPFFGLCSVGYLPDQKIVGLSKFARLLDAFANRLQVQERLTRELGEALFEHLKPKAVGVYLIARHTCIECRGVKKSGSETITCALFGSFKTDAAAKAEFLSFVHQE